MITPGEILFAVVVLSIFTALLYVYRHRRLWPTIHAGREWGSNDAVDLHTELEKHGIRAQLGKGFTLVAVWADWHRPWPREVRVHHADLARARPIVQAWAERYKQEREAQEGPSS